MNNRTAIVGYAQSPIQRHADQPFGALAITTAKAAIADAGLQPADIDGFVTSTLFPTAGSHPIVDGVSTVSADWMARHLGEKVQPRYVAGFQGIGQIPGSVALAVNALIAGAADYVVMHRALHNPRGTYHANPMREAAGPQQWTVPHGYFGPLSMIALPTTEYMHRYGATRADLAKVAVEARKNGARIPHSYWYGKPLVENDYERAEPLSDPICRYDCDIPVDGVAAFVFTTAERARDLPNRPVYVSGYATSPPPPHRLPQHWPLDDIMAGAALTVRRLGIPPREIDLPQVYDGFSPFVWFWLEALGLCPPGEAHRFVADGGIDSDTALPALSGGGALGNGRMHGIPQMLECYLQLSGRAGDRQRQNVSSAVACASSPHYGGAVAYSS
ncbi:thiolase family protein [Cryptosporangium sp. NPDC048952]|uniref:thiolase family protein n=1 Tax=Cryptosporangium sp. NPDC048952 TaxID=3363961 RepID=UPI003717A0E0